MSKRLRSSSIVVQLASDSGIAPDLIMSSRSDDIWLIGSSLMAHLEEAAISRRMPNLGLPNQSVLWLGSGGMRWCGLMPKFQLTMLSNSTPNTSVVHLSGNDLTTVKQGKLMGMIKKDLYYMASTFPSANIIWSDILPRLLWHDIVNTPENLRKIDQKRKRINRVGSQNSQQLNRGKAIIHEIDTTPGLHKSDGVHLTRIGNAIFLNTMEEALMPFLITLNNESIIIIRKKDFTQPPFIYMYMTVLAFVLQLWPLNWGTNSEFLIQICFYKYKDFIF